MSILGFLPVVSIVLALSAIEGYLLGSINWSIILTRLFKQKEDIRKYGSGNAGMTNVLRTVGKLPAILTFVGDFLKCVAAVLIAWGIAALVTNLVGSTIGWEIYRVAQYVAGVACVLGHIFPVYYGFKGGKGVVTAAAMIALLDWRVFLLVITTFLVVFICKRIISLASVICAATYPIYAFIITFVFDFSGSPYSGNAGHSLGYLLFVTACAVFIGGTVLIKHRANIARLRKGEEKPVSIGKRDKG